MATTTIRFNNSADAPSTGSFAKLQKALDSSRAREACQAIAQYFEALSGGYEAGDFEIQLAGTTAVRASGWVKFTSATGAVGATIGGTLKTVTWATSDAASIVALVAAINADTTINKKVYAVAAGTQANIFAVSPGVNGNAVTLALSGTGVTVSGANLTAGAGDDAIPVTFSRS